LVRSNQSAWREDYLYANVRFSGRRLTTSLKVGAVFEKRHDNILRDITAIQNTLKSLGRSPLNFEVTSYLDSQNREQPMYTMDRDAFSVLVFSFTGEKALGYWTNTEVIRSVGRICNQQ